MFTARVVKYGVQHPTDTTTTISPASLPAAATPESPLTIAACQRALPLPCASSNGINQVTCSASAFRWVQRSVTKIAEHLRIRLSPKPSSAVRSPHQGAHTTDLRTEDSGSSSFDAASSSSESVPF